MNRAVLLVLIVVSAVVGANEHGYNQYENTGTINKVINREDPKESQLIYIQTLPTSDGNYQASKISVLKNDNENHENAEVSVINIKSRSRGGENDHRDGSSKGRNINLDSSPQKGIEATLLGVMPRSSDEQHDHKDTSNEQGIDSYSYPENDVIDDDFANRDEKSIPDYFSEQFIIDPNESENEEDKPSFISRRLDIVDNGDDFETVDIDNPMLEPTHDHEKEDYDDDDNVFDQERPTRRFMGQDLMIDFKGRSAGIWKPGVNVIRTPTGPTNFLGETLYRPFPRFYNQFPFAMQHATPPPISFSLINTRERIVPQYEPIFNSRRLQNFEDVMDATEEMPTMSPHGNAYPFEPEEDEAIYKTMQKLVEASKIVM